jgi:hypothetical protein
MKTLHKQASTSSHPGISTSMPHHDGDEVANGVAPSREDSGRVCPHCELPAVMPEVCTPEINAVLEKQIGRDWGLYADGRESGQRTEWRTAAMLKDRTRRAIRERHEAGESDASLASDFGVPVEFIDALCSWQMFAEHGR